LIWQVESPAPIDGEGPSNWAARNSHLGFSGWWGTIIYGNWDTPMRWVTVTSVNPIKGGFTGDMTAIIGSPGHGTPAWNSDSTFTALFEIPPNRAGFFRHEQNSIQYWSPTLAGFSLRVMYAADEHKIAGLPNPDPTMPVIEPPADPWLLSGSIGWDNEWLRLRYSYEHHNDYYGMANLSGEGYSQDSRGSTDFGHLALASVKINANTDYQTRIVLTGDMLSYHTDLTPNRIGFADEFSRESFYGLIQQTFGSHHLWVAYGKATEGKCHVPDPAQPDLCTTTGLGADYYTLGYMYDFTETAGIYTLGYALYNDVAARYTPFPLLDARYRTPNSYEPLPAIGDISAGADVIGVGVGFVYRFNAQLLSGGKDVSNAIDESSDAAPEASAPPAAEPAEEPEAAPEPPAEEPEEPEAGGDDDGVDDVDLEEE
jgi:hypothetical protein